MAAISLFWDTNMAAVTSCAGLVLVARCDVLSTFFFSPLFVQDCSFNKLRTDTALKVSFQGSWQSLELVKDVIDGILS